MTRRKPRRRFSWRREAAAEAGEIAAESILSRIFGFLFRLFN